MVMSCNKQDEFRFSTLCRNNGASMYGRDDGETSPNVCMTVNKAVIFSRPIIPGVVSVDALFTEHEFGCLTSDIEFHGKACAVVRVACHEMDIASVVERTSRGRGGNVIR